ncbi:hypothetical protein VP1G_11252 [Cytospora mali]|uniref:Uncharacterized protein n=1 Tax=Cytospora mali TaxID=578113 RepID=A0A194VBU4_CYTMA|nr:hypothetical protein VP1G_11252 [Valsa mali var. pyri (nom. inval.)]
MTLTIPATWTQPAGCLATDDLYGYENPTGYFVDMLGAPSQTSSCYPSGYQATTSGVMYATACPDGFTSAGTDDSNSQLTVCCPSAYAFSPSTITFNDYTMLCASTWTSSTSITFTWLSFEDTNTVTATEYTVTSSGTAGTTTHTTSVKLATEQRLSGRVMHAMGIQISSTIAGCFFKHNGVSKRNNFFKHNTVFNDNDFSSTL